MRGSVIYVYKNYAAVLLLLILMIGISFNMYLYIFIFVKKWIERNTMIIRWRLINEKKTNKKLNKKLYKEGIHGGDITRDLKGNTGEKIDRDKSPKREQNKSALGSLWKSSMM